MTEAGENGPPLGGDDAIAAEYVLGVLPVDERQLVARRIDAEPDFARLVERWEARLAPLADAYQPVEPPAALKTSLDRRLFPGSQSNDRTSAPAGTGLLSSLAFWRGLAAAAIACLIVAVALPFLSPDVAPQDHRYIASLSAAGTDVKYLAFYDAVAGEVILSHLSGEAASGKAFELWMIEGQNPPVSMGIISPGSAVRFKVGDAAREKLGSGAVLAVSLEPAGGSPTGQPTGPVVASGDLTAV